MRYLVMFFLCIAVYLSTALAKPLKVGVHESPPFIIIEGKKYSGIAIDLWEKIARQNHIEFSYIEFESIKNLLDAIRSNQLDIAVGNISITEQRAHTMDLTQPWFDSGMRIIVPQDNGTTITTFLEKLYSAGYITAYLWILSIISVATLAMTLFYRRFDNEFPVGWKEGIAESFFIVMSTVAAKSATVRKNFFGWWGRILQGVWLLFGVAVVAFVTSSVTSVMTTISLTNQIRSLSDLSHRPIAVLDGSVEEEFLRSRGFLVVPYASRKEAVQAVLEDQVDAFVDDAPVAEYFIQQNPTLPIQVVGAMFERHKYGFALPLQSTLTRQITLEVLKAVDDDTVESLSNFYIGDQE